MHGHMERQAGETRGLSLTPTSGFTDPTCTPTRPRVIPPTFSPVKTMKTNLTRWLSRSPCSRRSKQYSTTSGVHIVISSSWPPVPVPCSVIVVLPEYPKAHLQ